MYIVCQLKYPILASGKIILKGGEIVLKILGIDHGAKTGIAYIINDKLVTVDSFVVVGEDTQDKFVDFYNKIEREIDRYKADILAIEKPMSFNNAYTSRTLIGYYSIIILLAGLKKIPVCEVFPTSMKKTIAGNGRANKDDVSVALLKRYEGLKKEDILEIDYYVRKKGVKNVDYDKSDALGLATYVFLTQA